MLFSHEKAQRHKGTKAQRKVRRRFQDENWPRKGTEEREKVSHELTRISTNFLTAAKRAKKVKKPL